MLWKWCGDKDGSKDGTGMCVGGEGDQTQDLYAHSFDCFGPGMTNYF